MCVKKAFIGSLSVASFVFFVLLLAFLGTTPAYANALAQEVNNGNCINCHEDLYFLHDTGNYFCIRESPMRCVDCHGGNPAATSQESAHYNRSAHPVLNEDISKCQECHPQECDEHVSRFDQVAGFQEVKFTSPIPLSEAWIPTIGLPATDAQIPDDWLLPLEILPLLVVIGLALMVYLLRKANPS